MLSADVSDKMGCDRGEDTDGDWGGDGGDGDDILCPDGSSSSFCIIFRMAGSVSLVPLLDSESLGLVHLIVVPRATVGRDGVEGGKELLDS